MYKNEFEKMSIKGDASLFNNCTDLNATLVML